MPNGQLPVASCNFVLSQLAKLAKLVKLAIFVAEGEVRTASQLPVAQLPVASCNFVLSQLTNTVGKVGSFCGRGEKDYRLTDASCQLLNC